MNDWFNITDVSDNIIITFNHTTTDKEIGRAHVRTPVTA